MVSSFRGLFVADAEGFSRNRDVELSLLHDEIRRVVAAACERSGLKDTWQGLRVLQSTGDGLFAVLPHEAMPSMIHPFADRLQEILAETAPRLRTDGLHLRLRLALHAGLVNDEHPVSAGISAATNDVFRLLDCEPLRTALRDSDPDVTFAAMVVSSEAFDMFVEGGHAGLRPSRFTPVRAKVKQFDRPAFLYVPVPSRREPTIESRPDAVIAPPGPVPPAGLSVSNVSVTGDAAQNVIGNQVGGSIWQNRS